MTATPPTGGTSSGRSSTSRATGSAGGGRRSCARTGAWTCLGRRRADDGRGYRRLRSGVAIRHPPPGSPHGRFARPRSAHGEVAVRVTGSDHGPAAALTRRAREWQWPEPRGASVDRLGGSSESGWCGRRSVDDDHGPCGMPSGSQLPCACCRWEARWVPSGPAPLIGVVRVAGDDDAVRRLVRRHSGPTPPTGPRCRGRRCRVAHRCHVPARMRS